MESAMHRLGADSTVSVVVPAYNVESYIRECVMSILNQTYPCYEVIVVDDGSTDRTLSIINEISKKNQSVQVIHKSNAGVSAARNTGIDAAKGDYIAFVDGDDYLSPDFIEYMVGMAQKQVRSFVCRKIVLHIRMSCRRR